MPDNVALQLSYEDFVHPSDPTQLARLIGAASDQGTQVRVRGALHSETGSVLGTDVALAIREGRLLPLMLDHLTHVQFQGKRVIAGAGVSLGGDPRAIGKHNVQGSADKSLFAQIQARGLSLPITGGISHQTLAGFLATGSAGGSIRYSFQDAIKRIDFIDGTGTKRSLLSSDRDFWGALVSLGLYGVVTEVELELEDTFDILGFCSAQSVASCDFDLFKDPGEPGKPSFVEFLEKKEYARAMWWPQPGVERIELWEAVRYDPAVHGQIFGRGRYPTHAPTVSPLLQLVARGIFAVVMETLEPHAGEGRYYDPSKLAQAIEAATALARGPWNLGKALYALFSSKSPTHLEREDYLELLHDLISHLLGNTDKERLYPRATKKARAKVFDGHAFSADERIIAALIKQFVTLTPRAKKPWRDLHGFERKHAVHVFRAPWHEGLPMDNPVSDDLLPVTFTELWLPMKHAPEALRRLRNMFRKGGLGATGTFAIELYAAKQSQAWISPAHGTHVFRIDPFWFEDGDVKARNRFFSQFWDLLHDLDLRLHWAKALPAPGALGSFVQQKGHRSRLAAFLKARQKYDPQGLFLTDYWAEQLGIPEQRRPSVHPSP